MISQPSSTIPPHGSKTGARPFNWQNLWGNNSWSLWKAAESGMSLRVSERISREEYERVVNAALDMGFEMIFTQDVEERALSPDFEKDLPFNWSQV
jgi:hypothetical protein